MNPTCATIHTTYLTRFENLRADHSELRTDALLRHPADWLPRSQNARPPAPRAGGPDEPALRHVALERQVHPSTYAGRRDADRPAAVGREAAAPPADGAGDDVEGVGLRPPQRRQRRGGADADRRRAAGAAARRRPPSGGGSRAAEQPAAGARLPAQGGGGGGRRRRPVHPAARLRQPRLLWHARGRRDRAVAPRRQTAATQAAAATMAAAAAAASTAGTAASAALAATLAAIAAVGTSGAAATAAAGAAAAGAASSKASAGTVALQKLSLPMVARPVGSKAKRRRRPSAARRSRRRRTPRARRAARRGRRRARRARRGRARRSGRRRRSASARSRCRWSPPRPSAACARCASPTSRRRSSSAHDGARVHRHSQIHGALDEDGPRLYDMTGGMSI